MHSVLSHPSAANLSPVLFFFLVLLHCLGSLIKLGITIMALIIFICLILEQTV